MPLHNDEVEAYKRIMNKLPLLQIYSVVISFFLIGCVHDGVALSPVSAVTQELILNQNALAETIHIHQTQAWQSGNIVLESYTSVQQSERLGRVKCSK